MRRDIVAGLAIALGVTAAALIVVAGIYPLA